MLILQMFRLLKTRARNYGLSGMMFGLGFIIGPALGGLIGGYSLRAPFFVAAGLSLINWLYGYFILPESLPKNKRSPFKLSKANPLATVSHLKAYPLVAGLAIPFLLLSLAHRGLENVWVLFTTYRFGWNEQTNGLVLGFVGLMAVLVQGFLVTRIIGWLGKRRTLIYGLFLSAVTFLGYGFATEGWMVFVLIALGALGGVTGPVIQTIVAGEVDSSEQGKVQGALTSLVSLTNIIAPIFFTAGLFSYFTSENAIINLPGAPFLVGSVLIFAAMLIAMKVFRSHTEN